MSNWPAAKARRALAALLQIGWRVKRQSGSHRTLERTDWPDFVFAFHDDEEIGPRRRRRFPEKNPTLTIVALAVRTGRHIAERRRRGEM